jgi:hypothetical protein
VQQVGVRRTDPNRVQRRIHRYKRDQQDRRRDQQIREEVNPKPARFACPDSLGQRNR